MRTSHTNFRASLAAWGGGNLDISGLKSKSVHNVAADFTVIILRQRRISKTLHIASTVE